MNWQTGLVLFYVAFVAQSLLQRSYSQKSRLPESFPPAFSYLLGVTPLGIIVGLVLKHHVHWSGWLILLLAIEGTFIGLYNLLSFQAIRRLPVARFQTLYQSYEIVVILLGWALLSEKLNSHQMAGGILLIIAAVLAIRSPQKNRQELSRSIDGYAVILTVAAAIVMGIGLVAEKAALKYMDLGAYFIFGYFTQTLSLLLLASKDVSKKTLHSIKTYDLKRQLAMGCLSACIGFFYIVAIVKSDNISLITALSAFSLPLVVLAANVFLGERDDLRTLWSAAALGCIGLLVSALH